MHMGLSDGETQSSLKQSPARVLFAKRAPAVLNRTPDSNYPTAALIYFCTRPEPPVATQTEPALIYNIR